MDRLRRVQVHTYAAAALRMDTPMMLPDLLAGYYVRRLQTNMAPHVCKMGHCRSSWNDVCRFHLPATRVVEKMYQYDEINRMLPRRTNSRR